MTHKFETWATVAAMFTAGVLLAAPHPHRGLLVRYEGAPPKIVLSPEELGRLHAGEAVMKQMEGKDGGRGMAVQDISAPVDVVWARILDFPAYPKMIGNVKEIEVYAQTQEHTKVRFVIGEFGMNLEYFIDHVVNREKGFITWTLDYDRTSELDDSVGYWFVEKKVDDPTKTRLYYSVDIKLRGWVPGFVQNMVREEGLVRATKWVKVESEKVARNAVAKTATPKQ